MVNNELIKEGIMFIKKRSILSSGIIVVGILAMLPAFSIYAEAAPKTIEMTYSFWGPPTESMAVVAKEYIAEIEERTNGRVKIAFFPGGSLTKLPQAYEGVVKGISTVALFIVGYSPGRFPLLRAFDLPLRIHSPAVATRIYGEAFDKFKPAEMADTKVMYVFGLGDIMLLSTKPINTLADLKGIKVRCVGSAAEYIAALGGTPVAMGIGDVYESMQKGIVDATTNPPNVLYDFKLADLVKYAYDWDMINGSFVLVMNLKVWNSLPSDIQQIFEETNKKYVERQVEEWEKNCKRGLEFGISKGMQVIPLTPEIEAQLEAGAQPVYDKYIADMKDAGLPGKEFLDYLFELTKKYE
jgi:TRAP-type C4-dicarboxylate transport system substrate-binding protein